MNNLKLSIVVPVYNMEHYLKKCLDSLMDQAVVPKDHFEVIVVNDGSTDSSQTIIDNYDWEDINHLVLIKENGGLSDARNFGFKYVKGEYVWFVDSDDWIHERCLLEIMPLLSGCDAIHFPLYFSEEDGHSHVTGLNSHGEKGSILTKGRYQYPVPFTIYRSDFLRENDLLFQKGIVMEDLHFTPRALYKANVVKIVSSPVYHYLRRTGSIMTGTITIKRILDRIWIANDLYSFMLQNVVLEDRKAWSECIATDLLALMYESCKSGNPEILSVAKEFINSNPQLTMYLKHARNPNNRIWFYLSKLFYNNYYKAYSVLYRIRY